MKREIEGERKGEEGERRGRRVSVRMQRGENGFDVRGSGGRGECNEKC